MVSLDDNKPCDTLFNNLSKAFDSIDHEVLKRRLLGSSANTVGWFVNYLSGRSLCIHKVGITSSTLNMTKGIPQGSVLGPLLIILHINNIGIDITHSYLIC